MENKHRVRPGWYFWTPFIEHGSETLVLVRQIGDVFKAFPVDGQPVNVNVLGGVFMRVGGE